MGTDITIKSTGALIDELITVNMKIFWALEEANKARINGNTLLVGEKYGMAQQLNSRRSNLIRAIDGRFYEGESSLLDKTF